MNIWKKICGFTLILFWMVSYVTSQEKNSHIAVIVGNETITKEEFFEEFFNKYPKEAQETLQEMIAYKIIRQEAIFEQISIEPETIQKKAKQELAEFQQQIQQSWQDYIKLNNINEKILIQKLLRKWKYNLTMEQLVCLFELRQKHIQARQIVTHTQKQAEIILEKLQKSSDFATLAREESISESRFRGGEMPYIYPGDLEATLEKIVFSLKIQEISPIVQSSAGYHIFQILRIFPGRSNICWQAVKTEIAESLKLNPISEQRFQRWLRTKWQEKVKILYQD